MEALGYDASICVAAAIDEGVMACVDEAYSVPTSSYTQFACPSTGLGIAFVDADVCTIVGGTTRYAAELFEGVTPAPTGIDTLAPIVIDTPTPTVINTPAPTVVDTPAPTVIDTLSPESTPTTASGGAVPYTATTATTTDDETTAPVEDTSFPQPTETPAPGAAVSPSNIDDAGTGAEGGDDGLPTGRIIGICVVVVVVIGVIGGILEYKFHCACKDIHINCCGGNRSSTVDSYNSKHDITTQVGT